MIKKRFQDKVLQHKLLLTTRPGNPGKAMAKNALTKFAVSLPKDVLLFCKQYSFECSFECYR